MSRPFGMKVGWIEPGQGLQLPLVLDRDRAAMGSDQPVFPHRLQDAV